jgi:hypothetical protein
VCVYSLKNWEKDGMLLRCSTSMYFQCVRVELVSFVCLSAEGIGKRRDAADVGVLLQTCESGACLLCVFIS